MESAWATSRTGEFSTSNSTTIGWLSSNRLESCPELRIRKCPPLIKLSVSAVRARSGLYGGRASRRFEDAPIRRACKRNLHAKTNGSARIELRVRALHLQF